MSKSDEVILKLENLKTYFPVKKGIFRRTVGYVKAIDGVDLQVFRGETLGLVGESGCGKTTLGKSILQLVQSTEGKILYHDQEKELDLRQLNHSEMKPVRKKLQIVFQDPHSSLNPAFTVFGSLKDPLKSFGIKSRTEIRKRIGDLLEAVNMRREQMDHYPHEFSGGQRQRIGIARALYRNPKIIIFDEATSNLDKYNEDKILDEINDNLYQICPIIISHRKNSIKRCDKIFILEKGFLKEETKYKEILDYYETD